MFASAFRAPVGALLDRAFDRAAAYRSEKAAAMRRRSS
jgi:hypothetical protein